MGQAESSTEIPKNITINVEFGKRMISGAVGIIYIWEKNEEDEKSFTISSEITAMELVKLACKTFDEDTMDFELTFCSHGGNKDVSSTLSNYSNYKKPPMSIPLEALTKVAKKNSSESLWTLGIIPYIFL